MKQYLLIFFLTIVGCITAMAEDGIKLTSGSISSIIDGGTGCVTIDMANTQFDNKTPLREDERFANVDEQLPECVSEFVREFNENSKKFKLTNNSDGAQYEFVVKITNLDTFLNVMSFKGGVGIKLWGTVTITAKSTGESVAVFTIDEEENSGFTYHIAFEEGFEGIAKFLAKRINKGK